MNNYCYRRKLNLFWVKGVTVFIVKQIVPFDVQATNHTPVLGNWSISRVEHYHLLHWSIGKLPNKKARIWQLKLTKNLHVYIYIFTCIYIYYIHQEDSNWWDPCANADYESLLSDPQWILLHQRNSPRRNIK